MDQIPTSFYVVLGVLITANFGVILSLLTLVFKAGSFVATTNAGIKEAKDTAVRAHKRVDKLTELNSDLVVPP